MKDLRLLLTDEDFKILIGGKVVEKERKTEAGTVKIKIALQDIGFKKMLQLVMAHAESLEERG
jgi:NOL1/NOP2/fmu family ribosome biogenesis protein